VASVYFTTEEWEYNRETEVKKEAFVYIWKTAEEYPTVLIHM
jgi:hypothetical protein